MTDTVGPPRGSGDSEKLLSAAAQQAAARPPKRRGRWCCCCCRHPRALLATAVFALLTFLLLRATDSAFLVNPASPLHPFRTELPARPLHAAAVAACDDLAADLHHYNKGGPDADGTPPPRLSRFGDAAYRAEVAHYWSTAVHDLRPACIVHPASSADVAVAVRALRRHPDVPFAVKSGGHDPNPGHASVDGGVLIALRQLKGATYDSERGVAYVLPGGCWNDVIGDLEPHGVAVVGGRLGPVGVGGYLTQGGLSYLSGQYGLGADNVVAWETVMANGTIVNITKEAHPELAVAMKGSGNQFGIVTKFTIKTHPMRRKIWGGLRVYAPTRARNAALQETLHAFITGGTPDPRAAIIFSEFISFRGYSFHAVFFFYDGEAPPATGAFADFLKIPALLDITGPKAYSWLLWSTGYPAGYSVGRTSFRTFTIPAVPNNPGIYAEIAEKWRNISAPLLPTPWSGQTSLTIQPLPATIGARSEAAGGNAMGLRGSDPNRVILELQSNWFHRAGDGPFRAAGVEMTDWLQSRLPGWLAEAGLEGDARKAYMPYFMNDATGDQDVVGGYRDVAKFRALQESVDPQGMFRTRVGGYRY